MECNHNFVRSGYGNDLICTKCGYAAMQGTLIPKVNIKIENQPPDLIDLSRKLDEELLKKHYYCKFVGG